MSTEDWSSRCDGCRRLSGTDLTTGLELTPVDEYDGDTRLFCWDCLEPVLEARAQARDEDPDADVLP